MHKKNIKVIAWATSIINNDSNIFQYAKDKGYLLNKGQLVHWWRGDGAFLDYYNP
jgi:alpha-glucosidase (family GH31 glycosyl hydrolase)